MSIFVIYLCLSIGLAAALVAGVFQSFSDFVMAGLIRARSAGGMESMQQLNRTVFRSVFLTLFLILLPVTISLAFYAYQSLEGTARLLIIAAGFIYGITVFAVTMLGNVPMNQRLDKLDADSTAGETYWRVYGRKWTRWNHIRTLGSAVTAALYLVAAVQLAGV